LLVADELGKGLVMAYHLAGQKTGKIHSVFGRLNVAVIYLILTTLVYSIFTGWNVSLDQYLFVLVSGVASAFLLLRKEIADYVVFCVVLFLVSPFVRRLADSHLGYSPISVIMMAPYIASSLSVVALVAMTLGGRFRFPLPIVFVLVSVSYGYLLAIAGGRPLAGTFDLLRWALPPCMALLIVFSPASKPEILTKLNKTFLILVPLISLYGFYQYVCVPRWDALWMLWSEMYTIGNPEPFEVRVFSTLNSPGSFSVILLVGILLSVGAKSWMRWVTPVLGTAALALTLVRSAWISLFVGVLYFLMLAATRLRLMILAISGVIVLAAPSVLVMTGTDQTITQRISTLFELRDDESANARTLGYQAFWKNFSDNLMGTGLAISGSYRAHSREGKALVIDGGPIEFFSALGIVFGTLYSGSFLFLCGSLAAPWHLRNHPEFIGCKAVVVSYMPLILSFTAAAGETGFMVWLAIGLLSPSALKYSSHPLEMRSPFRVT
jgi:hypothetical protein